MLNKADNYIQPTRDELRYNNIVMIGSTFLLIQGAYDKHFEALPLLSKHIEIHHYPYDNIIGVDLKNWIINIDIKHVIDALLLYNGFVKLNDKFLSYKYVSDYCTIRMGGYSPDVSIWYADYNGKKYPFSYLHELQNFCQDIGRQLSINGAF